MDSLIRSFTAALTIALIIPLSCQAEKTYSLREEPGDTAFQVDSKVTISGTVLTPVAQGAAKEWELASAAKYSFKERRLVSGGREALSLRAVRRYMNCASATQVGEHKTPAKLPTASLIVAEGQTAGVRFYSPGKQLTRETLDLLSSPGDTLAAVAMLPSTEVEIGEKWNPDQWVLQMLTDTEAAVKAKLTCELESVTRNQARVSFTGNVEGASVGSACVIKIAGHMIFDIKAGFVNRFELKREEDRSAGTVSPGLKVTANIKWDRKRSDAMLPDDKQIPATPPPASLELVYRAPWGVELRHDREWHVFNETDRAAVLRLVRGGTLVAQCNIARIAQVKPGSHTADKQFKHDIRQTLGDRLQDLSKGEVLSRRPYLYTTTATGESDGTEMQWVYYLASAANGQQVSLVYSVADSDAEKIAETHNSMTRSIQFPATRISRKKKAK